MLPNEIYRIIGLHCDAPTLNNMHLTNTEVSLMFHDPHFWLDKFSFDNLPLIYRRNSVNSWVNEYLGVQESLNIINELLDKFYTRVKRDHEIYLYVDTSRLSDIQLILPQYLNNPDFEEVFIFGKHVSRLKKDRNYPYFILEYKNNDYYLSMKYDYDGDIICTDRYIISPSEISFFGIRAIYYNLDVEIRSPNL